MFRIENNSLEQVKKKSVTIGRKSGKDFYFPFVLFFLVGPLFPDLLLPRFRLLLGVSAGLAGTTTLVASAVSTDFEDVFSTVLMTGWPGMSADPSLLALWTRLRWRFSLQLSVKVLPQREHRYGRSPRKEKKKEPVKRKRTLENPLFKSMLPVWDLLWTVSLCIWVKDFPQVSHE